MPVYVFVIKGVSVMKKTFNLLGILFACMLALSASPARAIPVTWSFNPAWDFDNPYGSVSGAFKYDIVSGTYSDLAISWNGVLFDTPFVGVSVPPNGPNALSATPSLPPIPFDLGPGENSYVLLFNWSGSLPASGTHSGLVGLVLCYTGGNDCVNSGGYQIAAAIGNITSSVPSVPIPAAIWLFGSGIIGLMGFTRKRV